MQQVDPDAEARQHADRQHGQQRRRPVARPGAAERARQRHHDGRARRQVEHRLRDRLRRVGEQRLRRHEQRGERGIRALVQLQRIVEQDECVDHRQRREARLPGPPEHRRHRRGAQQRLGVLEPLAVAAVASQVELRIGGEPVAHVREMQPQQGRIRRRQRSQAANRRRVAQGGARCGGETVRQFHARRPLPLGQATD